MSYLNAKTAILTGFVLVASASLAHAEGSPHAVLLDTRGQPVHNTWGNCVRTRWQSSEDQCDSVTRTELTVYFGFNKSTLSPESKQHINSLAKSLKSAHNVKEARIIGYADRIGGPAYNEKLSKKRAENVRDYLITHGYTNARVTETRWLGESVPATDCPDTLARAQLIDCLKEDRRVEIEIEYKSAK